MPKTDLLRKKAMLSVWWGVKGIFYREILSDFRVTADLYYQQLDRVTEKLEEERDRIYFLLDNARPHAVNSVRQKLLDFG